MLLVDLPKLYPKKTFSILCWSRNKATFCPRGRHYLSRLPAIRTFSERYTWNKHWHKIYICDMEKCFPTNIHLYNVPLAEPWCSNLGIYFPLSSLRDTVSAAKFVEIGRLFPLSTASKSRLLITGQCDQFCERDVISLC